MMKFSDWLTQKYLDWQQSSGERKTISQFAEWLGVRQPTLSEWMSGKYIPRGSKNVSSLAGKLGDDVYEVLGFPRPPLPSYIEGFIRLPLDEQERFIKAASESLEEITSKGINTSSPEAERIRKEVFRKYNFVIDD